MDIGGCDRRPVQNGHSPIMRIIAKNLGRVEAIVVNNPSLSLSVEIADKDVSTQPSMGHRAVQSYCDSLRINAGSSQKHVAQSDRIRQTIARRHFAGNVGIGGYHSRVFESGALRPKVKQLNHKSAERSDLPMS